MKSGGIMMNSVLLDTSFLIRLLNSNEPLHLSALEWFRYFLINNVIMKTSAICLAEYCVKGKLDEIPFRNIQVISFDIRHAGIAGAFEKYIFMERSEEHTSELQSRGHLVCRLLLEKKK